MNKEAPAGSIPGQEKTVSRDVETGPQEITADALKQQMAELKKKVEEAEVQKSKNIEEKIGHRETLIQEAAKNNELLTRASETLAYFNSMHELGQLRSEADLKKLKEIQTLVAQLEKKRDEIEQGIATISGIPEVLAEIHDAAHHENAEREAKALLEQAHKELDPQIDELGDSIRDLAHRAGKSVEAKMVSERDLQDVREKTGKIIEQTKTILEGSGLFYDLNQDLRMSDTMQEFMEKLSIRRKSLGLFRGKEKAAIDFILQQQPLFKQFDDAVERRGAAEASIKAEQEQEEALRVQYRAMLAGSWDTNDKIRQLTGKPDLDSSFSWQLGERMKERMEKIAGVRKGKSWGELGSTTYDMERNRILSSFANTEDAAWRDPRKKTQP